MAVTRQWIDSVIPLIKSNLEQQIDNMTEESKVTWLIIIQKGLSWEVSFRATKIENVPRNLQIRVKLSKDWDKDAIAKTATRLANKVASAITKAERRGTLQSG